jgi:GxxExxY protein
MKTRDELDALSRVVFDACVSVHKEMGPGLLESVYQICLEDELVHREVQHQTLVPIPLIYKGRQLKEDYIIDVLIEEHIILELKAIETIMPVHEAQLISYLKLADKRLGFLVNFNVPLLKSGFRRFVNNF